MEKVDLIEKELLSFLEREYGSKCSCDREMFNEGGLEKVILNVSTPTWSIDRENEIFIDVCRYMKSFCDDNDLCGLYDDTYILFK